MVGEDAATPLIDELGAVTLLDALEGVSCRLQTVTSSNR